MNIKPTPNGGRALTGHTPYGEYAITLHHDHDGPVYDADGNELGHVRLTIKTPPEPLGTPSRGLGDTIAKVTKAVGIKPCGGCEERRDWLNKRVPYK